MRPCGWGAGRAYRRGVTGAVADCERILDSMWGQPVNSVTTFAFVLAGVVIAIRPGRRWLAAAAAATGVGSFLFHGPMVPGSQWAHDVTLAWLLVVAGATGTRYQRWATWPALVVVAVLLAAATGAGDPAAGLAAAGAIATILWRDRSRRTIGALALLGLVAVIGRLGSTGGPLCRPDSILQAHGLWHLGAAAAVAIWATGPDPIRSGPSPRSWRRR